jgi:hypothetical protein
MVRSLWRTVLVAAVAVGTAVVSACGGGSDWPEGLQQVCDHISAAQSAIDNHDTKKAADEVENAEGWGDAAIEDTSGKDREVAVVVLSWLAVGADLDSQAARAALRNADQQCS